LNFGAPAVSEEPCTPAPPASGHREEDDDTAVRVHEDLLVKAEASNVDHAFFTPSPHITFLIPIPHIITSYFSHFFPLAGKLQ
jgi:hypothetical protein